MTARDEGGPPGPVLQQLGRLQGTANAILDRLDALDQTFRQHVEDDRRLGLRIGEVEVEQARIAGAEASAHHRATGVASSVASIVSSFVAIAASIVTRTFFGGSH